MKERWREGVKRKREGQKTEGKTLSLCLSFLVFCPCFSYSLLLYFALFFLSHSVVWSFLSLSFSLYVAHTSQLAHTHHSRAWQYSTKRDVLHGKKKKPFALHPFSHSLCLLPIYLLFCQTVSRSDQPLWCYQTGPTTEPRVLVTYGSQPGPLSMYRLNPTHNTRGSWVKTWALVLSGKHGSSTVW